GYLPIGGVMVSDRVADAICRENVEFHHGYTYSGHPAACAAALENLRILQDEKLVERVAGEIGPYFRQRWLALGDHPLVGEARAIGLMGALELVPVKPSHRRFENIGTVGTLCRDRSFANGLIMRAVRDTMIISPPLVISEAEADELIARARKTLDDTADALTRAGLIG
ncbi:MAG TPA: aminotransferase class III-fold pyridoxal phosphate-dependent enzyme, partial [Afifellaceae bacterium]|nr:aminotransferase class III-fold pyridoxal phosphate-dependent enzyme [Afifellaceae bacterium]